MGRDKTAEKNSLTVHVVSHTHWDREWYHTAAVFRQRLVPLVDNVLDALKKNRQLRFLLDGQAVILEDYLEVRPEQRRAIETHLKSGALEAGPWYVLADELIPTGEVLVRNLLAGQRVLRQMAAHAPPVLYSPDAFGHPAALPSIARGFGYELIILWRGFGGASHPFTNSAVWKAPDGAATLIYHLPRDGYEFGSALPDDPAEARSRWSRIHEALTERDRLGVVMLTNGADHHALQSSLAEAIAALTLAARPHNVRLSSLTAFARSLLRQSRTHPVPGVRGELRDSYGYTWTLQGTFASRSTMKRGYARASNLLLREAEPWSAIARARGGSDARSLLKAAWKSLLLASPHDTLCGCSTDEVAVEAAVRVRDATDQGREIARDACEYLAGYDREMVRQRPNIPENDAFLITNPVPRARGGVAHLSLIQKVRDVRVGPGSAVQPARRQRVTIPRSLRTVGSVDRSHVLPIQLLGTHSRYDLIESPQHYPDADIVMDRRVLVWSPVVPGLGASVLTASPGKTSGDAVTPENPAFASGRMISNGIVAAGITPDNRIWIATHGDRPDGAEGEGTVRRLLRRRGVEQRSIAYIAVEDQYDAGDLYTPSLRHTPLFEDRVTTARIEAKGPLRASLSARFEWRTRVEHTAGADLLSKRSVAALGPLRGALQVEVSVDANSNFIRVGVNGDNRSKHHRLRLVISGDIEDAQVFADAAFVAVRREALTATEDDYEVEIPPATQPMHRFVSLLNPDNGMTVFAESSGEYAVSRSGAVHLTVLRAVGELSRHDLPERPGHAGWPANTPLAQELGHFQCGFAWMPHAGGTWSDVAAEIERAADDYLNPLRGITLRSTVEQPIGWEGAELTGDGLAMSAIKTSEDGKALVLRCVNMTDRKVKGSWQLGHEVERASLARLDETPLRRLPVKNGNEIRFTAEPNAIVTILAK